LTLPARDCRIDDNAVPNGPVGNIVTDCRDLASHVAATPEGIFGDIVVEFADGKEVLMIECSRSHV
jgi:hypothetical protein